MYIIYQGTGSFCGRNIIKKERGGGLEGGERERETDRQTDRQTDRP